MTHSKLDLVKVPEVNVLFWLINIVATTLGGTWGDSVSISMNLGYLVGTGIFAVIFFVAVAAQCRTKSFHPLLYWTTIVATTTVGTTLADFTDSSLGVGYAGGSSLLMFLLLASLFIWHRTLGPVSIGSISSTKAEVFYWGTIMCSQTLGTALGDWTADTVGLGCTAAAILFGSLLLVVLVGHYSREISSTTLFWSAFILTGPLGAVVGDFLDSPHARGGLELSLYAASGTLLALLLSYILFFNQRATKVLAPLQRI